MRLRPERPPDRRHQGPTYSLRPVQSLGRGRLAQARGYRGRSRPGHREARASPSGPRARQACIPAENRIELADGTRSTTTIWSSPPARNSPSTRSRASVPRATPSRSATSITPRKAKEAFEALAPIRGPVVIGAVQGASCFGPAYEFAFILETELRRAQGARPRADDLRDAGALYRPSRPRRRRRHQGPARKRDARTSTSSGSPTPRSTKVEPGMMHVEEVARRRLGRKTTHELPFAFSMMLPAFRGVGAVQGHREA